MAVICYFMISYPNTEVRKVATTVAAWSRAGIKKYCEGIKKGIKRCWIQLKNLCIYPGTVVVVSIPTQWTLYALWECSLLENMWNKMEEGVKMYICVSVPGSLIEGIGSVRLLRDFPG